ncbi:MAG: hypothetical protein SP1CHLAM54_00270 [Chlamydiia bacterium]|nr:hypothetical protein [Chlamydiia bacterium]MCH9614949.1 hypothetical protein [Chlamydiia bacterium]MCH9630001.1 hypothetical protein [Chlamydiia bacterium]
MAFLTPRIFRHEPACSLFQARAHLQEMERCAAIHEASCLNGNPRHLEESGLTRIAEVFLHHKRYLPGLITLTSMRLTTAHDFLVRPLHADVFLPRSGRRLTRYAHLRSDDDLHWLSDANKQAFAEAARKALFAMDVLMKVNHQLIVCENRAFQILAEHVFTARPVNLKLDDHDRLGLLHHLLQDPNPLKDRLVVFSQTLEGPVTAHRFVDALRFFMSRDEPPSFGKFRLNVLEQDARRELEALPTDDPFVELDPPSFELFQESLLSSLPPAFPDYMLLSLAREFCTALENGSPLDTLAHLHRTSMYLLAKRFVENKNLPELLSHYDFMALINGIYILTPAQPSDFKRRLLMLMLRLTGNHPNRPILSSDIREGLG